MMITYVHGNIFESPAQTLVNTVNTVGVMGRGIAAEFKRLYPEMFKEYREACEQGALDIGVLLMHRTEHKSVLNFPTKKHWRHPSRPEYIEEGLKTFVQMYESAGIHSVAFPALGCGNGGLDFKRRVQPLMERYLKQVVAQVFIYPHQRAYHLPEHKDVETMRRWLRTAPHELPFTEVWEDLQAALVRRGSFTTFSTQARFTAAVQDDPKGLKITTTGKSWLIPYEDLLDFWQQLRAFGFVSNRSAPANRAKDASYIAPVLAALDYVRPVRIATDYDGAKEFERGAEFALQFIPPMSEEPGRQLDLITAC